MAISASETAARPAPPPSAQPVAIISGGSRGLGLALVERFLEGHRVATFSRSRSDELDALIADAPPETALWRSLNHADPSATSGFIREVFSRWGRIDVLVNNAGVAADGVLPLMRFAEIDQMISVNLTASVWLAHQCTRMMLMQGGGGSIVNISSVNALRGHRGVSVYSATKAALDGFTRSLAKELGEKNIRVNAVAPGYFESQMVNHLGQDAKARIIRRTPLRRLATVDDVVNVVSFLCSPAASFITGETIAVDGGLTC